MERGREEEGGDEVRSLFQWLQYSLKIPFFFLLLLLLTSSLVFPRLAEEKAILLGKVRRLVPCKNF